MNTDLTQRACANVLPASRVAPRPVSAHAGVAVVAYSAIPARIRGAFGATTIVDTPTALTGFAPTTTNPCVMTATWLGSDKHEHQRLKERSLA